MNNKLDQMLHACDAQHYEEKSIETLLNDIPFHLIVELYDVIISYALQIQKPLNCLTVQNFIDMIENHPNILRYVSLDRIVAEYSSFIEIIIDSLNKKIELGNQLVQGKTIIHTAPHHDDILLGYHSYLIRNFACNTHHIAYMTDGFHGVSNRYVSHMLKMIQDDSNSLLYQRVFDYFYYDLIRKFAEAFYDNNNDEMDMIRKLLLLKLISEVFCSSNSEQLSEQVDWLYNVFTDQTEYDNDVFDIRIEMIKGRLRQSESDCKWMIVQGHFDNVTHCSAAFYDDPSDQAFNRDVQAFLKYIETKKPDIITVALDPCGVGPSTHFNTLQVIAKALQLYGDFSLEIWGYRNVWSAFTIAQASMIIPVSKEEIDTMESMFIHCFATQQDALYPSSLYDGSFSNISRYFQECQAQDIQFLLHQHTDTFEGCIFLQKLTVEQLVAYAH